MDAGVMVAVLGTSIAAYYDIRKHRIPNIIPAAMFLTSLPLAFLGGYPVPWAVNTFLAAVVFYLFWTCRIWAAGDSKLLIAIAALVPQYPNALLPQPSYGGFFFLSAVSNLLLVYLLYTVLIILKNSQEAASFASISGSAIALSATAYDRSFAVAAPFLFSFLIYRTYSEAAKLDLTQTVSASKLVVGDNLAERIVEEGGRIIRERENPASFASLLRRLRGEESSSPAPHGLTSEEKDRLMGLVASGRIEDGIRVYRGTIMSPMILVSLIASVTLGDVLAAVI